MGLRSIQPYAPHKVLCQLGRFLEPKTQVRDLSKGESEPSYTTWYGKRSQVHQEPERPAKRPHVQQFTDGVQEQWDWLAKEGRKRLINGLRKKIAAENQERSRKDERLINGLRKKITECEDDLEKSEGNLVRARAQLAKNAEGRAEFVRQLKRKYEEEATNLKKKLTTLENEMAKQTKSFKAEREHCYALMAQLEKDLQQLQVQNHTAEQVLGARSQQIGRLLQEKGIIKERVRSIADYIVMKCNECEHMTRSMFFASVKIFFQQIMDDLFRLQEDRANRPAELDARVIDPSREGEESDVNLKEELHKLKHQMAEMYQAWMKGHPPPSYPANPAFFPPLAQSQEPPTVDSSPATSIFLAPPPATLHRSSSEPLFQTQKNQYYPPEPTFKAPDHYSYTPRFDLPVETEKPLKNPKQKEMFRKVKSPEQSFRSMQELGGQVSVAYKDFCLFPDV
ncbi:PREDICTED: uncharacterized protein LOC109230170 [Nicotiana attenuata]|uniref:uncharacterized protein LOC109230170 n=1 Tax=Nicotiana attenuata TaxID=49451 RepID=UPI000904F78D|nr:PREDICTED: uncharacterized protein LOC109230170 [Nicotiana attenuata]